MKIQTLLALIFFIAAVVCSVLVMTLPPGNLSAQALFAIPFFLLASAFLLLKGH